MAFTYSVSFPSSVGAVSTSSTSTPPTTNPAGVVITLGGGHTTANIPGPHNDPADLYGIVLVLLAIAVALIATRWLFGRGRDRTQGSGPTPKEREGPR